jgi:hypothetical protein
MADEAPISIELDMKRGIDSLVRAIRAEQNGKVLRRELASEMRDALKPAAQAAKSSIMGMSSSGRGSASPPLRTAIARRIAPQIRLSGRSTGAKVRARKINTRDFYNAPKRLNRASWRRPVFGSDEWIDQVGKPNWFDDAMKDHATQAKEGVVNAMEAMAKRLAQRTENG